MLPILSGAPWLIAHRSMLGINQPYKVTLNGQDYVLWQNSNGEISALNNICPHLQASLADGWICQERNTITCPFHAIEFDGQGRLYQNGNFSTQAITEPLELTVIDDYIWTYNGLAAKIPISSLLTRITKGFEFIGVAGIKSIKGDFLSNLLINYDYNHQNGTHRESFKIKDVAVSDYEEQGYTTKLSQTITRDENTLQEIINNPALLIIPKKFTNQFEYAFPCLTSFIAQIPIGQIIQIHALYPETEAQTKTFVMLFGRFKNTIIGSFLKKSVLKAADEIIRQDTNAIEKSYKRSIPKIRLPNEEIMFYAEKLYQEW
ncbi:Rieske (2Fe-2S) protein [Chroococcus sp. FPU101]|uniref:Rieske (2Fe-2S) protein n=1 Tax=Chroococcus sp. FPU101 TaxID=1974212 RepID=UPI001A8E0927|nr:Rieske 2Fe-2S domain-containing protein [Chroococcus sp. FPU101]GFE70442.1 Rieske (2Fe-2S) domain protein [Chroococcus sp. FPU101]